MTQGSTELMWGGGIYIAGKKPTGLKKQHGTAALERVGKELTASSEELQTNANNETECKGKLQA